MHTLLITSKRNAADVIHIENLTPTNDDIESVPTI